MAILETGRGGTENLNNLPMGRAVTGTGRRPGWGECWEQTKKREKASGEVVRQDSGGSQGPSQEV